jgi:hypothetical protein
MQLEEPGRKRGLIAHDHTALTPPRRRELVGIPHRARDPAADIIPPADEHPEDLRQATPEEVVALVGIEEHTTTRERSREPQRVLDGHERIVQRRFG